jgi:hypothetical protein
MPPRVHSLDMVLLGSSRRPAGVRTPASCSRAWAPCSRTPARLRDGAAWLLGAWLAAGCASTAAVTPTEPEPEPEPKPVAAPLPEHSASSSVHCGSDQEMTATSRHAYLTVESMSPAMVYIDGEACGVTPLLRLHLAPGVHRMVARNDKGVTKRFQLLLKESTVERVQLSFE